MDILSLQHCVIPWKVNLGLAYFSVYIYDENRKFCLKENHVMKLSALFSCNEPKTKSSVRYRRSCLQTEIRSYLYATWHSAVLKINEVWIFDTLRFREFCSAQIICRFCVWLKLLYCTSCKKICSCEDCMWIRWRTWLN